MKLIEAINRADELRPNDFTREQKIAWLSALDGIIKNEITDTHEDPPATRSALKATVQIRRCQRSFWADAPYDRAVYYISYNENRLRQCRVCKIQQQHRAVQYTACGVFKLVQQNAHAPQ